MNHEKMKNPGGSQEKKEDDVEKEVKERLLKLFVFMEKIYTGFMAARQEIEYEKIYRMTDEIFTPEIIKEFHKEVREIFDLASKCGRRDIGHMLVSLDLSLGQANFMYENNYFQGKGQDKKYDILYDVMQSIKVLIGAQQFFTKEREAEK